MNIAEWGNGRHFIEVIEDSIIRGNKTAWRFLDKHVRTIECWEGGSTIIFWEGYYDNIFALFLLKKLWIDINHVITKINTCEL